jgi:hypothetical protein
MLLGRALATSRGAALACALASLACAAAAAAAAAPAPDAPAPAAPATMGAFDDESVDYALPGPCKLIKWKTSVPLPPSADPAFGGALAATIGLPACLRGLRPGQTDPFAGPPGRPTLLFYNGFQASAAWYAAPGGVVDRAVSWGYMSVQYDTARLAMPSIAAEAELFPVITAWLAEQSADPASRIYGQFDPERLVLGGHSRGGKLAAIVFAGAPEAAAVWLLDPVDQTDFAPESANNPSAAKALAEAGRPVGVVGAGVRGSCNPDEGDEKLYEASAPGSWRVGVPGAGHFTFATAGAVLDAAGDALCGRGKIGRPEAAQLASVPMLNYFWERLGSEGPSPAAAFAAWAAEQEAAGLMTLTVKPGGGGAAKVAAAEGGEATKVAAADGPAAAPAADGEGAAASLGPPAEARATSGATRAALF